MLPLIGFAKTNNISVLLQQPREHCSSTRLTAMIDVELDHFEWRTMKDGGTWSNFIRSKVDLKPRFTELVGPKIPASDDTKCREAEDEISSHFAGNIHPTLCVLIYSLSVSSVLFLSLSRLIL